MVVLASSQEDGCAAAGAGADVQPHSTPTSPDGDPRAEDAEFQAVLLAGGRCARMFPLTEKCPKALLPVANRPVIDYGLDLLEKAGFSLVIIVTTTEVEAEVREHLLHSKRRIVLDVVAFECGLGSADVLRRLAPRIKQDFVVVSGDLVCEVSLHDLADIHRVRDASLTMMLKSVASRSAAPAEVSSSSRKGRSRPVAPDPSEVVVGMLDDDSRVVHLTSYAEVEDSITVPKSLLKQFSRLRLTTSLRDSHCYIFARWVLDLLVADTTMSSIQADLVPFLVSASVQSSSSLPASLDGHVSEYLSLAYSMSAAHHRTNVARGDLVRCHAMVVPSGGLFCDRTNTISRYADVSFEILTRPVTPLTPWPKIVPSSVHKGCLIGSGCTIGDRVMMKNCVAGDGVTIADGCKLNNCVIMRDVVIGSGCTLQHSVLCEGVVLQDGCMLTHTQCGPGVRVDSESILQGERLSGTGFV